MNRLYCANSECCYHEVIIFNPHQAVLNSMRILVISNYYPPFELGGMEQLARDVVERLRERGHQVWVLTSRHGSRTAKDVAGSQVIRQLHTDSADIERYRIGSVLGAPARRRENINVTEATIARTQPDIVFVWGMWNLDRAIPARAEELMSGRVSYYVASYWPSEQSAHQAYWSAPAARALRRRLKRLLGGIVMRLFFPDDPGPSLSYAQVLCVSDHVRRHVVQQAEVMEASAHTVHNGIDPERFDRPPRTVASGPLRLLHAGRLVPEKGVITAIEALALVIDADADADIRLTIVGQGPEQHIAELHSRAGELGVADYLRFVDYVPYEEMPKIMAAHDVYLFTSTWPEPLARVVEEAMASRMIVIGTRVGGTLELLDDGVNGLTFEPNDAQGLASAIRDVVARTENALRFGDQARLDVLEHFTMQRMVEEIEIYLEQLHEDAAAVRGRCSRPNHRPGSH